MTNPKHQITATWPGKGRDLVYKDATGKDLTRSHRYFSFAVVGPRKPTFHTSAEAAYRHMLPKDLVVGISGTRLQTFHMAACASASAAAQVSRDYSQWDELFEMTLQKLLDDYDAKCRAESGLPARKEN